MVVTHFKGYELVLQNPEIIWKNPLLAAAFFGISLSDEFYVCEVGNFEDNLEKHLLNSPIHYISHAFLELLQLRNCSVLNQGCIRWLNHLCSPEQVKEAMSTQMPIFGVRTWSCFRTHKVSSLLFVVLCL